MPLTEAEREAKRLKGHLKSLTDAVLAYLAHMDVIMSKGSTVDRGKAIARMGNALEMANDSARFSGLGVDYRKPDRAKNKIIQEVKEIHTKHTAGGSNQLRRKHIVI